MHLIKYEKDNQKTHTCLENRQFIIVIRALQRSERDSRDVILFLRNFPYIYRIMSTNLLLNKPFKEEKL